MNRLEKVLYTAKVHTTGGRAGGSRSSDSRLEVASIVFAFSSLCRLTYRRPGDAAAVLELDGRSGSWGGHVVEPQIPDLCAAAK